MRTKKDILQVKVYTRINYEIFKKTIDSEETIIDTGLKYKVKKVSDEKKAKKEIKKDEDILLIINNDENDIINVTMITYGYINSNLYQLINSSITASNLKDLSSKVSIFSSN